mmetsp:Transcript_40043/g.64216  ORF Transcript_40043/g.64216 Transcript_40043/m.64216 type:complete len:186 (+) Transcript_40043:83-640(+)
MYEEEKRKKKKKKKKQKKQGRNEERPKEWTERTIHIRELILKLPGNTECADCTTKYPDWSSINLGVMICTECAGIHRGLGVHISKVRSIEMDVWSEEQLTYFYRLGGNTRVNGFYEASLRKGAKPTESDRRMSTEYIRQKYKERAFIKKDNDDTDDSDDDSDSDDEEEERRRSQKKKKKKKGWAR